MSYPSLVASDGQEATHLCRLGLTSPPSPAARRSPGDSPDVPRFLCAARGPQSPNHRYDIAFVTPESCVVTFPQSLENIKAVLPVAPALLSVLFQMLIWLAGN